MPLFESISVDVERLRQVAKDHWNVELGDCLKASQNHTYMAVGNDGERFVLRVMPDPDNTRLKSIELEVGLLDYLHENKLPVCCTVKSSLTSSSIVHMDTLVVCLFVYATGEPVVFTDWKWMKDRNIVFNLGRWFALLHKLTREFAQKYPELSSHARHWQSLHDGVLAGVEVDAQDQQLASDPNHFGLIHGDVNPSNYFWDPTRNMPSMFDWDQLQRSWFLYDLSAPIWGVVALEKGGSPIDQSKVEGTDPELYTAWLLEGYESEGDKIIVDRNALKRMVLIRRELYRRFCRKALLELPEEHPMAKFCKFVTDFFDNEEKQNATS